MPAALLAQLPEARSTYSGYSLVWVHIIADFYFHNWWRIDGLSRCHAVSKRFIPKVKEPATYSSLCHRELPEPIEAAGVL